MSVPGSTPRPSSGGAAGVLARPPLLLIFSVTVTGILANTLVNAPLPDILDAFGQADDRAGLVVSAATLPGIIMAPVIGLLADRYGRRRVLVPCLVVFGVFGVLGGLAPSFGVLLLCRLGQGFGSAGLINLAIVLIADSWEGRDRVRLIGYNSAVLTVSVALLPGVGGWIDQVGGWRWSFAPYALALVTAAAAMHYVPDHRRADPPTFRRQTRDAFAVLRTPIVAWSVVLGFVLFALIFGLFLTAMPILLTNTYGLAPGVRGFALALPAIGSTTAALVLARTRTRLGARGLLLVAAAVLMIGFTGIGLATSLAVLAVGAVVYGLGEGSTIPTVQDIVAGSAPDASRGAVLALFVGASRAGQTVGPQLADVAIGTIGPAQAFVIAGLVCAGLLVVQLLLPRRWFAGLDVSGVVVAVGPASHDDPNAV